MHIPAETRRRRGIPTAATRLRRPNSKNFRARFAIAFSEPFVATGTYAGNSRRGKRKLPGEKID
jgi:hypothetical protein